MYSSTEMTFFGNQMQKTTLKTLLTYQNASSLPSNCSFALKKWNEMEITGMYGNYWVYFFLCF